MFSFAKKFIKLLKNRSGSPLVEETVLIGLALFALMTVVIIILDLIDFTDRMFQDMDDGLW
jgi:hypothetical protein